LLGSGLPLGWLCINITLAELFSIAALNISLGCTTLEFKLPIEIISYLIILFAEFRQTRINFSFTSSLKMGIKISATSLGEVIFFSESHFVCDSILRFNSNAARRVAALSFPIPLVFIKLDNESVAKTARFLFLLINSCATLITDFPFVPVLSRIAISSASVKF
jgi:hypothetical protein